MKLGELIEFRKDLYFEGAVQADWFYDPEKASLVSENFVFHGKDYFGVEAKKDSIDTISLVKAISGKIGDESSNPRSLAIADYGTGKSHFAVTLAQLLSGPSYMPETYKKVLHNIDIIDHEAAVSIKRSCKDRNLVIMLNGIRDFNLHSELLKATQKSLKLYGVSDDALKSLNKTIDTANRFFELNANSRIADFERFAEGRGWREKGTSLISKIRETLGSDDIAFEVINDVYETVTGQRIRWEEGISAKAILEMLLSTYCGLNGQFDHVIILFDEFGRFLEYASGTDGGKCGDNALQEIFEVSQNAAGSLHIVNFIQTDIKTYLLRVDSSRNLSRYIGRYDESEKYHISSNLETVFANLISRKDKDAFVDSVVAWQSENESTWQNIYSKLNSWVHTSGVWSSYEKYRKVIVEGIYPMHPISVFMLTQLSDYLQNRSSMTLISQYIAKISDYDLADQIPIVIPTDLMSGDLFVEMLAAETSGRHRSDNCIKFENVLKKNAQKLNDKQIAVLRANLITRTLRFNTKSYEDAKESLVICSGLTESEVDDALHILVDEYATMAFDETSGCFDFTEDAKGAYDYKILKRRLMANRTVDLRMLLKTAKVLDIAGISQLQATNFSTNHKITTNEWNFSQELVLAEDVTKELISKYKIEWERARSVVTPKGRLVWVYANKDTDYEVIEQIHSYMDSLGGLPIVLMLLNDADNKLKNILVEYDVLDHMDDTTRQAYSAIFVKDQEKVEENLKNAFDSLRKNREQILVEGTSKWTKRLPVALTEIFESIYPEVIPYNFDGLLTSANNFNGKGVQYYCQILKMFLSNKVNFDTIHDFQRDIRNRIDALFMTENAASWKCITSDYAIVAPLNTKVRNIYNCVAEELESAELYECRKFFNTYCAPPYGLSEEAAAMFIGIIIENQWHNVRIQYDGAQMTVAEWKDYVIDDKKLHIDALKSTAILWVDTGSLESKYQQLFKKIDVTRDIAETMTLFQQLQEMERFYGLPESQEVYKKLASQRYREVENALGIWKQRVSDAESLLDDAELNMDVPKVLDGIESIDGINPGLIFTNHNIDVSEEYKETLRNLEDRANRILKTIFNEWVERKLYCQTVASMPGFEKFYIKCRNRLQNLGYLEMARAVVTKGEKELNNKKEIKSRQELIEDGQRFIKNCESLSQYDYIRIKKAIGESAELKKRFAKYGKGLGEKALIVEKNINTVTTKLENRILTMDNDMNSVFDQIAEASSVRDVSETLECIDTILKFDISETNKQEFIDLKEIIEKFLVDVDYIKSKVYNRKELSQAIGEMRTKYSDEEFDYDFSQVIEDCIEFAEFRIKELDRDWCQSYLTLKDKERRDAIDWKSNIKILPAYLSEDTLEKIKELDKEADQIISNGKIDDVVYVFQKLSSDEKEKCIKVLEELK